MALLDFATAPHGGSQRHLPEWESQPRITPTTIIDHSVVGSAESAWQMFATRSGLESHFIVRGRRSGVADGHIWQLVDTGHQADANLDANGYAISIETEDDGDPDTQPWTLSQLRSLQWLHTELRRIHPTIPRRESRSCADPGGLGYHTLHGAPSCWTPVAKSCPGTVRKRQWHEVLLPAYLTDQAPVEDDVTKQEFLDAMAEFYRDGIIAGQNTHADTYRVIVDRQTKQLAEQQATNAKLDQVIELLTPPEPPPPA